MASPMSGLGSFANINKVMSGGTSGIPGSKLPKIKAPGALSKSLGGSGIPKLSSAFNKAAKGFKAASAPKGLKGAKSTGVKKSVARGLLGTAMGASTSKGLSMPKV